MPRLYEIEIACRAAIVIEPNGRRTITTRRFPAAAAGRYCWFDMTGALSLQSSWEGRL